ncbi:hypothetical protein BCR42DRAFT_438562 [Absidia repens]|uniref:Uncharacterized protein n=1 Tax=Absidia repens TaxID=90262 RepID=A0A1X2IFA5_9FUNG|nr:hypothetical protein BCR42DRAFT_438562 [Absidia repens]
MMRMLGIAFLGLFLWAISVVHAQYPDFKAIGVPNLSVIVCTMDNNNKCSYSFEVTENDEVPIYYIRPADCHSAQKNGYTFTRTPDDKSFNVQSPCSGMSFDTLREYSIPRHRNDAKKCMMYAGPICRRKTTA